MAKKKEIISVEDKLRALYDLQLVDCRIDEIRSLRGELPLEVEDLENEIEGLNKRLSRFENDVEEAENGIKEQQNKIEEAGEMHKKYEENLKTVRNNREYNSIIKEQEYQTLEIELAEKKIKGHKATIAAKQENMEQLKERIAARTEHLNLKNGELDAILKETKKEESVLLKKSKEFEKVIDDQLVTAYKRIRNSVKNGLAIVPVERGASGGSFFAIPPQVQIEIASRKKIITDEHSGRILIDLELATEEKEKIKSLLES